MICKCFYISHLCVKREKRDGEDSEGIKKDEDLTFLTFYNRLRIQLTSEIKPLAKLLCI